MKTLRNLLSLAMVVLLSQCASRPPHAPGDNHFSGDEELAYRRAYYHGFEDGKRDRDDDFERYHNEYDDRTEKAFERGYDQGYEAGREQADAGEEARDAAFNQGVELGRADCENALTPFYQRHQRLYTSGTESSFRKGYVQGYQEAREDNGGASVTEKKAYDAGYRAGESDHERGRQLDEEAHRGELGKFAEDYYFKGYRDGFNHRTPRF